MSLLNHRAIRCVSADCMPYFLPSGVGSGLRRPALLSVLSCPSTVPRGNGVGAEITTKLRGGKFDGAKSESVQSVSSNVNRSVLCLHRCIMYSCPCLSSRDLD